MMKKLLLLKILWVFTVFCGEAEAPKELWGKFNYCGDRIVQQAGIYALMNQDCIKGMKAFCDLPRHAVLSTDEAEWEKWKREAQYDLDNCYTAMAQLFEECNLSGNSKDAMDSILIATSAIKTSSMTLQLGLYLPKWIADKAVPQQGIAGIVGRVSLQAALTPFTFPQGIALDMYAKLLAPNDHDRHLAWSKVVAFTGDGF